MSEYILEVKEISKEFPGVKALNHISLKIKKGEIHALVGENGAGKSTLMKILNGNYKKDGGSIFFDGKEVDIKSPVEARELGISIIFQELNLVPTLSIAENMFMGRLMKNKRGLVDWSSVYEQADGLLKKIGYPMDSRILVETLSVAQKQMVEIAKALSYQNTRLILMDEPSATLTQKECRHMFSVVRELKAQGVSVIYISHKLEEIDELCEWVTVLRDGQIIDSKEIGDFTRDEMITKMIGREITNKFPKRDTKPGTREVLRVEGLSRKGIINQVDFTLYEGEVLGFAGLVGAGRTEIARAVCGIDYRDSGTAWVDGKKVSINSPKEALRNGLVYLSEDRRQEGLVVKSSVKWNLTMAGMKQILSAGIISGSKEKAVSNRMVEVMHIKTPGLDQQVVKLSGGNQQKIVIGKWLNTEARIFIFDEPTRGIDVGAKHEVYVLINQLVKEGKSVILISSEMPEVVEMSDRVLVVKEGRISGTLVGQEINAKRILENAI